MHDGSREPSSSRRVAQRVRSSLLAVCGVFCTTLLAAQTIQVPRADALVRKLLAAHPEMQTIGIHTTPPGQTQNNNIACSKPGKVGKVSAEIDITVIATGKPYLRHTERGAIDMGLPFADAQDRPLGMVVIVLRESFTHDDAQAMKRATLIRDELQKQTASANWLYEGAAIAHTPLYLVAQTPLPNVRGDFDHLALDVAHNRLYPAAEDNHSIEVFNRAGDLLRSLRGIVKMPHTLAYDTARNELLVSDEGDSSCLILGGDDLHLIKRIALPSGPAAALYDAQTERFYLGLPGKAAHSPDSHITIVSAAEEKQVDSIQLDGSETEGMALDRGRKLLFVNLRDKSEIAFVQLQTHTVTYWKVPDLHANTTMAYDEADHLLMVAGRSPGRLFLLDPISKTVLQTLDTVDGAEDMTFDPTHQTLYISGIQGLATYHLDDRHHLELETRFPTMKAKTSVLDQTTGHLFLIHGTNELDGAALEVYRRF